MFIPAEDYGVVGWLVEEPESGKETYNVMLGRCLEVDAEVGSGTVVLLLLLIGVLK